MIKFQKPRIATAFDIHPLIADRYSPRAFSEAPITKEELGSLFEAARWAPSSMNEQPWRFIFARKGESAFSEIVNGLLAGNKPWAQNAPVLMITLVKNEFLRGGVNISASHDLGLAVGNMSLQAQHLGIGIHQMGGISREYLTNAFNISQKYSIVTVLAIGHYGVPEQLEEPFLSRETQTRSRKDQTEFVFHGTFNN